MPILVSTPVASSAAVVVQFLTVTIAGPSQLLLVGFSAAPAATSIRSVTVTRMSGSTQSVVRGMDGVFSPRGVSLGIDHEAPSDVAATYTATAVNAAGAVVATSGAATVQPASAAGVAWLKSLRTPVLSQALTIATLPEWSRALPLSLASPVLGKYPTGSFGVRSAVTGQMGVHTFTRADRIGLDKLLATPGPYLLQFSPATQEPDRYVLIGDVAATRHTRIAADQGRLHTLPLTEVARPMTAGSLVAVPGRTFAEAKPGAVSALPAGRIVDYAGA